MGGEIPKNISSESAPPSHLACMQQVVCNYFVVTSQATGYSHGAIEDLLSFMFSSQPTVDNYSVRSVITLTSGQIFRLVYAMRMYER